jgi:hypothetical protein
MPVTPNSYVPDEDRSSRRAVRGDRRRARREVNELVASFQRGDATVAESVTVRRLFDNYVEEVTPGKSERKQQHDRACAKMFKTCFGPSPDRHPGRHFDAVTGVFFRTCPSTFPKRPSTLRQFV